jgi:hypothetical protein
MLRPGQRVNNLDKLIDANLTAPTAVSENPLAATHCSEVAIGAICENVYDIVDENGFQEANSALPQDAPRDLARDVIHRPQSPSLCMDYCCIAGLGLYWPHRIFAEDTSAAQSDRPDRRHRYFLQALTACISSKSPSARGKTCCSQPPQSTARMSGFFTIRSLLWQRQIRNGLKDVH